MGQMYLEGPVAGFGGEGGEQCQRKYTQNGAKASSHEGDHGLVIRPGDHGLVIRSGDTGVRS